MEAVIFSHMSSIKETPPDNHLHRCRSVLAILQWELLRQFGDFKTAKRKMCIISSPLHCILGRALSDVQCERTDLHSSWAFTASQYHSRLFTCQERVEEMFKFLFLASYIWEQTSSGMKPDKFALLSYWALREDLPQFGLRSDKILSKDKALEKKMLKEGSR